MRKPTASKMQAMIDRRGWVVVQASSTDELVSLADSLGEITPSRVDGPPVDELRPKPASLAPSRSLSGKHGLGAFPFHTDAAHHEVPPRYVLLRLASQRPSTRRTLVAPMPGRLTVRDRDVLEHDVWLVDGGRGRFLTSVLTNTHGARDLLRFDEGCMRPADNAFGDARAVLLRVLASRSVGIAWVPSQTVVLDNWRTLHAREGAPVDDEDRVLERVLVR